MLEQLALEVGRGLGRVIALVGGGAVLVEHVGGDVAQLTGLRVDQQQLLLHADLAHGGIGGGTGHATILPVPPDPPDPGHTIGWP